tara:strand:+ start:1029 stop:1598 length:570 start_codon:yes stop_codon:yes gene_type:complete
MKSERILYVILILTALGIGIYGYLSGLFTPHHYHAVTSPNPYYDSCKDEAVERTVVYINQRENYLIMSRIPDRKYKLESSKETLNMYIYQDLIPFEEFARLAGGLAKEKGDGFGERYFGALKAKAFEKYKGKMVPISYMAEHNKIDGRFKFWKEGLLAVEDHDLEIKRYVELRNNLKTCEITKQFLQRN